MLFPACLSDQWGSLRTNSDFAASGPHGLEIDWLTPSTRVLQTVSVSPSLDSNFFSN